MTSESIATFTYRTATGPITITATERGLSSISFGYPPCSPAKQKPSTLTNQASNQLQEYFAGKRRSFDLPLDLQGSAFQKSVWEALRTVPFGETRSTADIAAAVGSPKAFARVGSAIKENPLPIVVPDHRVVNAKGQPLGTGSDITRRSAFLSFEKKQLLR